MIGKGNVRDLGLLQDCIQSLPFISFFLQLGKEERADWKKGRGRVKSKL